MSSDDAHVQQAVDRVRALVAADAPQGSGTAGLDALMQGLDQLEHVLAEERAARTRAEAHLRDEVDAYEHSAALLCSIRMTDQVVVKANQTLLDRLGLRREALLQRPAAEMFPPALRQRSERLLRALAAGEVPRDASMTLQAADGRHVQVLTSGSRSLGSVTRLRLVWRDVTTERRLEAQLRQSQKMEAVGRLASGIAHDFNNMLAVVQGSAELAMELTGPEHPALEELQAIVAASGDAAGLTRQLLSFTQARGDVAVADIGRTLMHARSMLERSVGPGVRLRVELPARRLLAAIDPTQLTQVLLNLVVNASDAMPAGGALQVTVAHVGGSAIIRVADEGTGMSTTVAERALDPFFTTKEPARGTGLGLSVCYHIVTHCGGTLTIASTPGAGTEVEVQLPLTTREPKVLVERTSRNTGHGQRVLVVDDDPRVARVIERVLGRSGYAVYRADGGEAALALCSAQGVDVVVTDVVMPSMTGPELAQRLWDHHPELPVIFVSGQTGGVSPQLLARAGAFLSKPFSPAALLTAVAGVLEVSA